MSKKEEIMDATFKLLLNNGLISVSMSDIKREANTSPGTIFYYFDSKDELIEEVLSKYVVGRYFDLLDKVNIYDGSAYDSLQEFYREILEVDEKDKIQTTNFKNGLILFFEGKQKYENIDKSFKEYDNYFTSILNNIIEKGKKKNEIRTDLDTTEIIMFIKFHIYGIFFLWMVNDVSNVKETVEVNFRHMWAYIKK